MLNKTDEMFKNIFMPRDWAEEHKHKAVPGTFWPVGPFGDTSLATCWDFSPPVSAHTSGNGDTLVVSGRAVT